MQRHLWQSMTTIVAIAATGLMCRGADPAGGAADVGLGNDSIVWIYRDVPRDGEKDERRDTERLFRPFGLMPAERAAQVSVNEAAPVDRDDPGKGTCIAYTF